MWFAIKNSNNTGWVNKKMDSMQGGGGGVVPFFEQIYRKCTDNFFKFFFIMVKNTNNFYQNVTKIWPRFTKNVRGGASGKKGYIKRISIGVRHFFYSIPVANNLQVFFETLFFNFIHFELENSNIEFKIKKKLIFR